jgi:hypothetical protein
LFMASTVFLKSAQRIMALAMIMTLSLLVYSALEHRIRESSVSAKIEPNPILSYPLHTRPCLLSGTYAPVSSGFPVTSRPAKMW